jgi:uncharacterized protein (TIRG00374 family)
MTEEGGVGEVGGEDAAPPRVLVRVLGAAAMAGALVWALHGLDLRTVGATLAGARPGWLALAVLLNLVAVCFQAGRWLALLRPLLPGATLGSAFKAMVVGTAVSAVVPARAGELARIQWFARRTGLARASIAGSIVLDYVVNAVGLLLGLAVLPYFLPVPAWIRRSIVGVLIAFAAAATLVLIVRPSTAEVSPSRWRGRLSGLTRALVRARQGLAATNHPRALAGSILSSLGSWTLEVYVIAAAMKALAIVAPVSTAVVVLMAVNLALAIPGPPGNIGTLELGATVALVGFGVAKEKALALGVVYHLLQLVPIGLLAMLFVSRADKRGIRLTGAPGDG